MYDKLITNITKRFPKQYRDDLNAECFILLHEISERYNGSAKLSTYAYKHLYFKCLDYVKKERVYALTLDNFTTNEEGEKERFVDSIPDTYDFQESEENSQIINKHIESLTDIEFRIMEYRIVDGFGWAAIASHMNLSEKTCRKYYNNSFK